MNDVVWVNEKDEELGIVSRKKAHEEGLLHRIAVVYILQPSGEILVQVRADTGQHDHSSAGHVDPGESYEETARRELFEELGIRNVALEEVGICTRINDRRAHLFKVFKAIAQPGKLNPEEVKTVFWANPEEIWQDQQNDMEEGKYTGGFKETLTLLLSKKTSHMPNGRKV